MGNSRRLRGHKQMSMGRRSRWGKRPMSDATKADRKKKSEEDRIRTKAALEKQRAKTKSN
jgi:hypothetical protein